MNHSNIRWVLAFNASCGTCRAISERVAQTCDGKLEILPLSNANVEQWREQALGPQAPWLPTLLRIANQGNDVQAWTGPAMGLVLARRLGLRSTMRVLAALAQLQRGEAAHQSQHGVIGRAQFLRLCASGTFAAGLLMLGKMPAFAAGEQQAKAEAQAWVEAHKNQLPQTYDDLLAHPMAYRRAIYQASTPQVRRQFWAEQLNRYRAAHPALSEKQQAVLDRFQHLANTDLTALTEADHKAAVDAFGENEAHALFATLGPDSAQDSHSVQSPNITCNCTYGHSYCSDNTSCHIGGCGEADGCGPFWSYRCNGLCY